MAIKYLHHAELFIRHAHYSDMPLFGQYFFNPFYMNVRIFPAAAMTHIYRELKHLKSVFQDVFTEIGIDLTLFFCFRR